MRRKKTVPALLGAAALLTLSACGNGPSLAAAMGGRNQTITVWLMSDAQQGWADVVADANARFHAQTGANVNVQYQNWPNHLIKLESVFAGTDVPDVVELGNTEVPKYVATGAFASISDKKAMFDNSDSWLPGLLDPCMVDGQLYCIPYYSGARVAVYRTDLIPRPPATIGELEDDLNALKANHPSTFSPFYLPGKYWYAAISFIAGQYGPGNKTNPIADHLPSGQWQAHLDSQQGIAGLEEFKNFADDFSVGSQQADELTPDQDTVFQQGKSAVEYALGQHVDSVQQPFNFQPSPAKGKVGAFALPGNTPGSLTPSFLGGEDLGVPAKSSQRDLASQWIQIFTDTQTETALIGKGVLPNAGALLNAAKADPKLAAAAQALTNTWFVPSSPHWSTVENESILPDMLSEIMGGTSITTATDKADAKIDQILNG